MLGLSQVVEEVLPLGELRLLQVVGLKAVGEWGVGDVWVVVSGDYLGYEGVGSQLVEEILALLEVL